MGGCCTDRRSETNAKHRNTTYLYVNHQQIFLCFAQRRRVFLIVGDKIPAITPQAIFKDSPEKRHVADAKMQDVASSRDEAHQLVVVFSNMTHEMG